jgi:mannitol/fructose-specific phosphotransferase system IIA component (Ntr-type)
MKPLDSSRTTVAISGNRRITLICLSGLVAADKRDAIDVLVRHITEAASESVPAAREISDAVFARESLGSTSVGDGVAFPHAVLPAAGDSVVCVAAAATPILWDPPDKQVRLVVLFVGGPESHLPVMSQVARALRQSELVEAIGGTAASGGTGASGETGETGASGETRATDASDMTLSSDGEAGTVSGALSAEEISRILRSSLGGSPEVRFPEDSAWNRRMIESAVAMRGIDTGISVALIAATFSDTTGLFDDPLSREIGYLLWEVSGTRRGSRKPTGKHSTPGSGRDETPGYSRAPRSPATRLEILPSRRIDDGALHNILEREYGRGAFADLTSLVVLWGVPGSNRITRLLIHHFGAVSSVSLPPGVSDFVLARVMQLARDIAIEGREGKPVGASFVIGNVEEIGEHTTQMIINPFSGCPETERNILDPSLEETVKEFARIDGAFVIHGDGLIESAGTYLSVPRQTLEHDAGHGARHTSAQGITAVCECVAVVVSESTRRISVFRRGERVEVV